MADTVPGNFDSGNIDVVSMESIDNIQLGIHEDPFCESDGRSHYQCAASMLAHSCSLRVG